MLTYDIQKMVGKLRDFLDKEMGEQNTSDVMDVLMNTMVHIGADTRPDLSIPEVLDILMDDLRSYQKAAQVMVEDGDIDPPGPKH